MRSTLKFESLNDMLLDTESLLASGYTRSGNWSLGQICNHLRLTMESNINGYPLWMVALGYPLRPILRWYALPKLMAGKSPKGLPTAPMFIPANGLDDATEIAQLKDCVATFLQTNRPMHPHPGFGAMTNEAFAAFHAAHAAHHLCFLNPKSKAT